MPSCVQTYFWFVFCFVTIYMSPCIAEQVGEQDQSYIAKFDDGTAERYIARYTGVLNNVINESGHPSEPLKGWFTDTRQCHWQITTEIVRQWCLVSKTGAQFCDGSFKKVWSTLKSGQGSDLVVFDLAPENCGSARLRYNSDVNDLKNKVSSQISNIVKSDIDTLSDEMKNQLKAVSVTHQ